MQKLRRFYNAKPTTLRRTDFMAQRLTTLLPFLSSGVRGTAGADEAGRSGQVAQVLGGTCPPRIGAVGNYETRWFSAIQGKLGLGL